MPSCDSVPSGPWSRSTLVVARTPLQGLGTRLAGSEPIARVVGIDGATLGAPSNAQPLALAGLAEASRGPLLVVTATQLDAERLASDLACFATPPQADRSGALDERVLLFPSWDTLPLERISPDVATMGRRMAVRWRLASDDPPVVVVASVRALLQQMTSSFPAPLVVRAGDSLELESFVHELVARGYRREPQVEHRGEFAVRGGIIDVFGSTAQAPIRIDLFGDDVERLTTFDVADQRARDDVAEAWVFGCREFTPDEGQRDVAAGLAERFAWASSTMQRIADGGLFDGMEGWFGLLTNESNVLPQLLGPDGSIVLVEPRRVRDRAVELLDEERALVESLVATWAGSTSELDPASLGIHANFDDLFAGSSSPVLSLVPTVASDVDPQIEASSFTAIPGDAEHMVRQVLDYQRRGFVVVALGSSEPSARRLVDVFADEGVTAELVTAPPSTPGIFVGIAPLSQGFVVPLAQLAVLSESDITGRRVAHRPKRTQQRVTDGFFDALEAGNYVVHRVHGIARFVGVVARSIGGTTRDYMVLEFRGDDRIYLPVDQIDALTPYSGGESPTLSRMGGSDWQRTRAKAKAAADEIAEELVALYRQRSVVEGFAFSPDGPWQLEMESAFPYELTPDQAKAVDEIKADMEAPRPMDRLVVADVGFGKTEIAVRAGFKAIQDGKQVAVLVPTTLLASQHFQTFAERYRGYPVSVALLSRFLTDAQVREVRHGLAEGTIDVVVGTHRLLSEDVVFKDLGLLVVDEEQRFGVTHKEAIKKLSKNVDVLTLSANPIPRTLEMALTGIRDLSMVTTPPVDRRPILTYVGEFDERAIAEAIRRELLREGQIFYVHNRVADIDDAARRVRALVPEARVAIAHGQMDEGTLESIVMEFAEHNYDVLVCTTIVESGIDMPSVNTMVVDRADRLGLGQLHQLRGRVGRSGQRAYAYLFHPHDKVLSEQAYERLRTIGEHTDLGSGFKIAMRDLEIRGAGNLLGRDQSGHVAAVGYDLYVQLVAESVAEAKGEIPVEMVSVSIDVPGDAHLPPDYVAQEDMRLEAYRRLATTTSMADVEDLGAEWLDRFGPLPDAAVGLLELARLRVACLARGISEISILPARVGGRAVPLAKISPMALAASAQIRVRRTLGERAYDEAGATLRVELGGSDNAATHLRELIEGLVPET
jgi:transcription-repair coupling factor (superfamily II helicase)